MANCFDDVRAFHRKFMLGAPRRAMLPPWPAAYARLSLLQEETHELAQAIHNRDLICASKEAVDVIYIAIGQAVEMGLPIEAIWREVHRSNMDKVLGPGKRGDHDIIKPHDWIAPRVMEALIDQHAEGRDEQVKFELTALGEIASDICLLIQGSPRLRGMLGIGLGDMILQALLVWLKSKDEEMANEG